MPRLRSSLSRPPKTRAEEPAETFSVARANETFKDRMWLWCHVEGAHDKARHHDYGFGTYKFTVSPGQAADLLGIENVFMVKYNHGRHRGPTPSDFSSYYDSRNFGRFKNVIWSLGGGGGTSSINDRKKALKLTHLKTNIVGFVMDDFFANKERALSPRQFSKLRERLAHAGPNQSRANLWAVVYDTQICKTKVSSNAKFARDLAPWLKEVDGITLWFKKQESLTLENMDTVLTTLEGH